MSVTFEPVQQAKEFAVEAEAEKAEAEAEAAEAEEGQM